MGPRTVDRAARRADLVAAATRAFAERGVTATSVADIVRAAGVSQGTFYLYFTSKDDAILAVVEAVAERTLDAIAEEVGRADLSPADRLNGFGHMLAALSQDSSLTDVAEFIHRPDNQRLHDRFAEHFLPRLVPLVEQIINDGVADGTFEVADVHAAAWFILGGLRSIELAGTPLADMPAALDEASRLALRTLGAG
ncbi:MAG: TetR/AcrR family transcriptional regulator [Micropruina sp.]|nr:TetR/AcrR family transcriptional regulator [Micropruina sp.]